MKIVGCELNNHGFYLIGQTFVEGPYQTRLDATKAGHRRINDERHYNPQYAWHVREWDDLFDDIYLDNS